MSYYVLLGVKVVIAIGLTILFGNGCVVFFNRLPVQWFAEEKEDGTTQLPEELQDLGDGTRQRLPSTPWKFVFTGYFGITGLFLALYSSLQYEVAVLFVMAIVLEMAICDKKYQIVPDMFSILLAVSALGFITFQEKWWDPLLGALYGAGMVLLIHLIGKLFLKKDIIGGADLKFFLAIGLITGSKGVLLVFIATQLIMGIHAGYLYLRKRVQKGDTMPLLPYVFLVLTVYFLFFWDMMSFVVF